MTPSKYWKEDPEPVGAEFEEYSVRVISSEALEPDGKPQYKAFAKWDGCVNILFDPEDDCYAHFCDINELIDRLIELRDMAREKFPDSYK